MSWVGHQIKDIKLDDTRRLVRPRSYKGRHAEGNDITKECIECMELSYNSTEPIIRITTMTVPKIDFSLYACMLYFSLMKDL